MRQDQEIASARLSLHRRWPEVASESFTISLRSFVQKARIIVTRAMRGKCKTSAPCVSRA